MIRRPSVRRIIETDYAAFLAFLFPIVLWGVYILLAILRSNALDGFATIGIAITVIAIVVLIWRIRVFFTIFDDALEARATISNVFFFRDRGRITYVYTHQGQKYISSNTVHRTRRTQSLAVGDQVTILIDRNNPKRAFIRDLYL